MAPLTGFHFRVDFEGITTDAVDARFQSVAGLEVSLDTESLREGGVNGYEHVLPNKASYSDLVLKRGLVRSSALIEWVRDNIERLDIRPVDIVISLLDEMHEPVMSWNVSRAWPKKWSVSEFNAEKGDEFAIESLELTYRRFEVR